MNRVVVICYFLIFFIAPSFDIQANHRLIHDSVDTLELSDGPYVFIKGDQLIEKSIAEGKVEVQNLASDTYPLAYDVDASEFNNITKVAVLSDIHGQYELCLKLFRANHIIDKNNQWTFGAGHLVVAGDIFDRGDKVTEALWFIYHLEKQAKAAGGKIHYLMGNHEYMALQGDLRYVHKDYMKVSEILGMTYDELYGDNTVLGRWLRSKSTIIKINDVIYLHGGISNIFMGDRLDLEKANQHYRESMDMKKADIRASEKYAKYYNSNSPIWYRGYFKGDLSTSHIDSLLQKLEARHIIVGHTSQEAVMKMYDARIYVVDSSMKNGEYGEILIIEEGVYKRFSLEGQELKFD